MRTWFMVWMFAAAFVGYIEAFDEYFHDDRPWWGRAIGALLVGGILAAVPGSLAVLAGLP